MSPPGLTATRNHPGGSTPSRAGSPIEAAIRAAHDALTDAGVAIAPRKVNRIVRRFAARAKADGWTFDKYLAEAAELTDTQRRRLLAHPDWEVTIAYLDPTGETAVANVMRERRCGERRAATEGRSVAVRHDENDRHATEHTTERIHA